MSKQKPLKVSMKMHNPETKLVEDIKRQNQAFRHFHEGKVTLMEAFNSAFEDAMQLKGKLPESVHKIQGMTGRKYRLFINNFLERVQSPRYLEVGAWQGSSFCSAIHGNDLTALAIDNWTQYAGPIDRFYQNLAQSVSGQTKVSVLCKDFRNVDYQNIGRFNAYLFDGPHMAADQYDGIERAMPALDHEFLFVCDDWNWARVRHGTHHALSSLGIGVLSSIEIRTTEGDDNDDNPPEAFEGSDWHNGYYLAILRK